MKKIFHYIFRTYKKKRVLDGWIAEELESIFKNVCREKGFKLICQSILVDHVHLLIRKSATDRNEYVMKMVKGISSRQFFKKYPSNRFEFRKLWGRSYRAEEIKGKEHLNKVINYVKRQKINGIDKRIKPNWKPRRSVSGFQL